jgi:ABC-type phosphate/phosphonate transport system permease subunit
MSAGMKAFLRWLSYILPNFENFGVMAAVAHGRAIPAMLTVQNTAYAALYCAIVLGAAATIFARRNLK